jgi:hypothetical protein
MIRPYHHRIQANMRYNWRLVQDPPVHPDLCRFSVLLEHGQDMQGYCVYRLCPRSQEVLRIDFEPPGYMEY